MGEIRDELVDDLRDKDFRHDYASEFIDMVLARQIRAIRKQRNLTQQQLAALIDSRQSFISEIEDEDYGSLSLNTLKELARAFDTYLDVRFVSFKALLDSVESVSLKELQVPPFTDDAYFSNRPKVSKVTEPPVRRMAKRAVRLPDSSYGVITTNDTSNSPAAVVPILPKLVA